MREQVIALAGLMQALTLVQQIAETGRVDSVEFETILNSLLQLNAATTAAVYGDDLSKITMGLDQLIKQLSSDKAQKNQEILRHTLQLLQLERKLAKVPNTLETIGNALEDMPRHIEYFDGINSPQVLARIAEIYHQTISQMTPRIQVQGNPTFLQQPDNVNRVRALLLGGIRAAVLWRQKGGKRRHFVFSASKILKAATALRATL